MAPPRALIVFVMLQGMQLTTHGLRSNVEMGMSESGKSAVVANKSQTSGAMCPPNLPELAHINDAVRKKCKTSAFGTLFVGCVSASGLMSKRWYRNNRPLCRVEMVSKTRIRKSPGGNKLARVGKMFETSVQKGPDPKWNTAFHYEMACLEAAAQMKDYMLQVQVKDKSPVFGTKSHLGYAYVDFANFDEFSETTTSKDYDLGGNRAPGAQERTTVAEGQVNIFMKWCPFGDDNCLSEAARGLHVAGTDWTDCHDGCHNALVEKLKPIYDKARHLMASAVQAGKDKEKFDDMEDNFQLKAEELENWLDEHPIREMWKHWVRPGPPPCPAPPACPPGHGGEGEPPCPPRPPCPGPPPLTPQQQFALVWQGKEKERIHNEAQHEEYKRREEAAKEKAKRTFSQGKEAMDRIGEQLIEGGKLACGDLVTPFMEDAGNKIAKMPEGKFKIRKAEEAVSQLDAVWRSIAEFKDCLFSKWKQGDLLPSRQVEMLDEECYGGISHPGDASWWR
jgi:hypothetical protein